MATKKIIDGVELNVHYCFKNSVIEVLLCTSVSFDGYVIIRRYRRSPRSNISASLVGTYDQALRIFTLYLVPFVDLSVSNEESLRLRCDSICPTDLHEYLNIR